MADTRIPMIQVKDLYKIYKVGTNKVYALNGVDFTMYRGNSAPSSVRPVRANRRCSTCLRGWKSPRRAKSSSPESTWNV